MIKLTGVVMNNRTVMKRYRTEAHIEYSYTVLLQSRVNQHPFRSVDLKSFAKERALVWTGPYSRKKFPSISSMLGATHRSYLVAHSCIKHYILTLRQRNCLIVSVETPA